MMAAWVPRATRDMPKARYWCLREGGRTPSSLSGCRVVGSDATHARWGITDCPCHGSGWAAQSAGWRLAQVGGYQRTAASACGGWRLVEVAQCPQPTHFRPGSPLIRMSPGLWTREHIGRGGSALWLRDRAIVPPSKEKSRRIKLLLSSFPHPPTGPRSGDRLWSPVLSANACSSFVKERRQPQESVRRARLRGWENSWLGGAAGIAWASGWPRLC
ncbi:hypothetical protein VTI74DRAFT_3624 [Chaetomium olivicolor]